MKKLLLLITLLVGMLYATPSWCTTYYISQSTGSNSNNGTAKGTPWKSHPWMPTGAGCSGSGSAPTYTHSAGDQFIFMGGDTWPNACWYINAQAGGSSPSNHDYYGVDKTWWNSSVCGASWCRPIFDEQSQVPVGGAMGGPTYRPQLFCPQCGIGGVSYITVDNWEIKNVYWDASTAQHNNGTQIGQQLNLFAGDANECNYLLENLYLHKWTHAPLSSGQGDILVLFTSRGSGCGPGGSVSAEASGDQVLNSVMDNSDGSCDSGQLGNGYQYSGNVINCVPNGVVGPNFIYSGNIFMNSPNSYDDATVFGCVRCVHENGYEGWTDGAHPNQVMYIFDNVFHDLSSHGFCLESGVQWPNGVQYVFNNVIWNCNWGAPINIDTNCVTGSGPCWATTTLYYLNNTLVGNGAGSACFRNTNRGTGAIGAVYLQNNHCITDNSDGLIHIDTGQPAPTTFVTSPNLIVSTASATTGGFTISNAYRPPASSNPTVGVGNNFTSSCSLILTALCSDASGFWNTTGTAPGDGIHVARPSSGNWNAGAYMFGGTQSGPPPAPFIFGIQVN